MPIFTSLLLSLAVVGQAQAPLAAVPFHIATDAIIVDGKVNGRPVSLLFDSGFGGTILLNSGIDVGATTGTQTLRDFVGELHVETVKLDSLQIGSMKLNPDEKMIVKQPSNFSAAYGQHVDGILGLGSLKNFVTQINFQKQEFLFYPSTYDISKLTPDNKKTFQVKMLPIGGNAMELPVLLPSGQEMTMALDTGNAFYATTHRDVLERVGAWPEGKKPTFMRLSGVASGAVESWSFKMPPLNLFGVPIQPTVWDVIDLPSSDATGDGTVGFGFLSNFNITFDYSRRRVWLENWKTPVENEVSGDVGISARYDPQSKRTVIALVAPGSPADAAGVKEDDELLAVGSAELEKPSFNELRQMLEGPVGSTVEISVSRDGGLKRFTLTRKALYN